MQEVNDYQINYLARLAWEAIKEEYWGREVQEQSDEEMDQK